MLKLYLFLADVIGDSVKPGVKFYGTPGCSQIMVTAVVDSDRNQD